MEGGALIQLMLIGARQMLSFATDVLGVGNAMFPQLTESRFLSLLARTPAASAEIRQEACLTGS
jgi:hypothetical protein